jgi:hypothetical protein
MIALKPGYNEIRWTAAPQPLQGLVWLALIERAYGRNLATGTGFIGYDRGDRYPNLSAFATDASYLVFVTAAYDLPEAVAAEAGSFPAFNGYVPTPAPTMPARPSVPATIPGTVNAQTAAVDIIGGTLVARTDEGLIPYSTRTTELRYLLFGFALNSALAGGTVQVQRNGHVTYPGLGLTPGATLLAGDNGRIVYSSEGMGVHHVIGRATTDDSFSFTSSYSTIKLSA